jgi:hypothetical protein
MCIRFHLVRSEDVSGVSGLGVVAEGVVWADGSCTLHWETSCASINIYRSLSDLEKIHGHSGSTIIVFDDPIDDKKKAEVKGNGN